MGIDRVRSAPLSLTADTFFLLAAPAAAAGETRGDARCTARRLCQVPLKWASIYEACTDGEEGLKYPGILRFKNPPILRIFTTQGRYSIARKFCDICRRFVKSATAVTSPSTSTTTGWHFHTYLEIKCHRVRVPLNPVPTV